MPSDQGEYSVIVPENNPADTEPDLADEMVVLDVRVRDDRTVVGNKEYVPRAVWAGDRERRAVVVAAFVNRWLDALEERRES